MADNEAVQRRCGNHVVVRVIRQSSSTLDRSLAPSVPPLSPRVRDGSFMFQRTESRARRQEKKKKDSASPPDLPELGMMALGFTTTTTTTIVQASAGASKPAGID